MLSRVLLITRILPSIAVQSNQPIEVSNKHLSDEEVNAWIYAPLINVLASRYHVESRCMYAKLNDVNRGWVQPHRIVLLHLLSAHYAPPRSQSIASLPELSIEKTRETPNISTLASTRSICGSQPFVELRPLVKWIAIASKMSGPTAKSKRGPTVLMTDARDAKPRAPQRPAALQRQATGARLISVDNILQYASDIPSQQQRGPPGNRPMNHTRTPSGRHPLDPRLTGRLIPQHMPTRSSKLSEKLVLLPETEGQEDDEKVDFDEDEYEGPPTDEELARRTAKGGPNDKSYAERLPKAKRTDKLSRVTAYCTAQAYKMKSTAEFVKDQHHARTKLYDDCLYTVYHLPLLPGNDGYRVRSSPALKSPGGKTVLDEEIERNEQRDHHEGYFGDEETYYVRDDHELDQPYDRSQDRRDSTETSRVAPNALTFG